MHEPTRRAFLRGALKATPFAAGAAVVTATATRAKEQVDPALQSMQKGLESLKGKVKSIDERIETLEKGQRRWVRVAVAAAALSLGIDVSALL